MVIDFAPHVFSAELREKQEKIKPGFPYQIIRHFASGKDKVFLARRQDSGQEIVLKKARFLESSIPTWSEITAAFEKCADRFLAVQHMMHPHIVRHLAMELLLEDNELPRIGVFMEFCPGGTLFHKSQAAGGLNVAQVKRYTAQIINGLGYIHEKGICHLDLKGENILLTAEDTVKLADFGEIVKLESASQTQPDEVSPGVGTPRYMAPEMIDYTQPHRGRATDIYSFGCVLIEMITGQMPQYRKGGVMMQSGPNVTYFVGMGGCPEIPCTTATSQDVYLLLRQCIQRSPDRRPTVKQIARHPSLRWSDELPFREISERQLRNVCCTGDFYQSTLLDQGQLYAVRSVKFEADRTTMSRFLDEVNVLTKIGGRNGHSNIIQMFGACFTGPYLHLVVENFTFGSLTDLMRHFDVELNFVERNPDIIDFVCLGATGLTQAALADVARKLHNPQQTAALTVVTLIGIAYQICSAMAFLELNNVAYLNLCSQNILFSPDFLPKLTAFENAVEIQRGHKLKLEFKGSFPPPVAFRPPEVKNFKRVNLDTDVWSYGALLFALFRLGNLGDHGWKEAMETSEISVVKSTFSCTATEWVFPSEIAAMLTDCLKTNRKRRPTFAGLMERFKRVRITRRYVYYQINAENAGVNEARPLKARSPLLDKANVFGKRRSVVLG